MNNKYYLKTVIRIQDFLLLMIEVFKIILILLLNWMKILLMYTILSIKINLILFLEIYKIWLKLVFKSEVLQNVTNFTHIYENVTNDV